MLTSPGGYLPVDNVAKLIQEVKNILDKKDVMHRTQEGAQDDKRFGTFQRHLSGNAGIERQNPPENELLTSTDFLRTNPQFAHKESQNRQSGFGSSVKLQSSQNLLQNANHFRIASAAGNRLDSYGNPGVSFEHETSLHTTNSVNWPKISRKLISSGGIPFRFAARLGTVGSFIEQYDRVKVSLPNPVASLVKNLLNLQVQKKNASSNSASRPVIQKLQISSTRIVDYSKSSTRSLEKSSSTRNPKRTSAKATPNIPTQAANTPIFAIPPGQGPKNMIKHNHILDQDTADVPSLRDLPVCERPATSFQPAAPSNGLKNRLAAPQPVDSRPEAADSRPNTRCRRALANLSVYSPAECADSRPSEPAAYLPKVGKTFSLRPNRSVVPSRPKNVQPIDRQDMRATADADGWTLFRELLVERSVQQMQAFLLAELKQRAAVSEAVQTESPALVESRNIPETAQCNFVPVFPVEIRPAGPSEKDSQDDEEEERVLTVYAERDWRVHSANKEGLYEALRDQLERTSERMSLERAKESMKQAKAAQLKADQEKREKLAKQQLLRDSSTSVDFISGHSEQYCRHLDCLTSGLSEEHYVHIADARQFRNDAQPTTPVKPKMVVNLYGSRLLEETLSAAPMLSPSQESLGSAYVRIGNVIPHGPRGTAGQRVTSSTKVALSALSSSRESGPASYSRLPRPDTRMAAVPETNFAQQMRR